MCCLSNFLIYYSLHTFIIILWQSWLLSGRVLKKRFAYVSSVGQSKREAWSVWKPLKCEYMGERSRFLGLFGYFKKGRRSTWPMPPQNVYSMSHLQRQTFWLENIKQHQFTLIIILVIFMNYKRMSNTLVLYVWFQPGTSSSTRYYKCKQMGVSFVVICFIISKIVF